MPWWTDRELVTLCAFSLGFIAVFFVWINIVGLPRLERLVGANMIWIVLGSALLGGAILARATWKDLGR